MRATPRRAVSSSVHCRTSRRAAARSARVSPVIRALSPERGVSAGAFSAAWIRDRIRSVFSVGAKSAASPRRKLVVMTPSPTLGGHGGVGGQRASLGGAAALDRAGKRPVPAGFDPEVFQYLPRMTPDRKVMSPGLCICRSAPSVVSRAVRWHIGQARMPLTGEGTSPVGSPWINRTGAGQSFPIELGHSSGLLVLASCDEIGRLLSA